MCSLEDIQSEIAEFRTEVSTWRQDTNDRLDRHNSRIAAVEQNYLTRDDVQSLMDHAIEKPMNTLLEEIRGLREDVSANQGNIARHERRLNPWLRMWDAGREIWDARSSIVKILAGLTVIMSFVIATAGVWEIVTGWVM